MVMVVCFGCMLVKMSNIDGDISAERHFPHRIFQGICSSLASVWIEKMMKVEDRPKVSEDESKQKLYWFLSDSFQMYMFGIPIYLFGSFSSSQDIDIPMSLGFALVAVPVYYKDCRWGLFLCIIHLSFVR